MNETKSIVTYATGMAISNMFDVLDDDTDPPGSFEATYGRSRRCQKSKKPPSIPEKKNEPGTIVLTHVTKQNIQTINPDDLRYTMSFADYAEKRDKTRLHAKRCLQSRRSRKPGEGEDQWRWDNLVRLNNKREEAKIVAKVVEPKAIQRADRIQRVNNITYTINSDYGRKIIGRASCPRPKTEHETRPPQPPAVKDARQFPALRPNSY